MASSMRMFSEKNPQILHQQQRSGAIVPTHLTGSERLGAEQYLLHYRITHFFFPHQGQLTKVFQQQSQP